MEEDRCLCRNVGKETSDEQVGGAGQALSELELRMRLCRDTFSRHATAFRCLEFQSAGVCVE